MYMALTWAPEEPVVERAQARASRSSVTVRHQHFEPALRTALEGVLAPRIFNDNEAPRKPLSFLVWNALGEQIPLYTLKIIWVATQNGHIHYK